MQVSVTGKNKNSIWQYLVHILMGRCAVNGLQMGDAGPSAAAAEVAIPARKNTPNTGQYHAARHMQVPSRASRHAQQVKIRHAICRCPLQEEQRQPTYCTKDASGYNSVCGLKMVSVPLLSPIHPLSSTL
jgi:hypothetical protein